VSADRPRPLASALIDSGTTLGVVMVGDDRLDVQTTDLVGFTRALPSCARAVEAVVAEVRPLDDDLESVFRYLVGAPAAGG
jgi:ABC-2 type transport system ATP-binding protein